MSHLETFQKVLREESKAIAKAMEQIDEKSVNELVNILSILAKTGGSLVFCGVGKSGLIGQKMASTFCSLGLSSYFLHPTEALHGDIGRLSESDGIVLISKSGTSKEIIELLPYLPMPREMIIGLIGIKNSTIGDKCRVVLDCSVEKEACLNNLAPTTSSTVTLAIGDAMGVVYEQLVGLSKEKFALNHPGGLLGKSLRLQVKDLMIKKADCAIVYEQAPISDVILAMTKFNTGLCAVLGKEDELLGIIVEGDIRRSFLSGKKGLDYMSKEVMTADPLKIDQSALAYDALCLMERGKKNPVNVLPVLENNLFVGTLRLHDLLQAGFSFTKQTF